MTERGPGERFKVQTFCQSETGMKEYICLCEACVVATLNMPCAASVFVSFMECAALICAWLHLRHVMCLSAQVLMGLCIAHMGKWHLRSRGSTLICLRF